VIAYFDTSSVIPLLVAEPGSRVCTRVWNDADRVVSVRLLYPEARAALAMARRTGRLTARQLTAAVVELDELMAEIDHVEVTPALAHTAGALAQDHELRGYDAVHLAAALAVAGSDVVFTTGDVALATAGRACGMAVAVTSRAGDAFRRPGRG